MKDEEVSTAMKIGHCFGNYWNSYKRFVSRFTVWLCKMGCPLVLARLIGWGLQVVVIGSVICAMSFTVLIIAIAIVGISGRFGANDLESNGYSSEWKDGPHGFGLYDDNGIRLDPYDPDGMP